MSVNGDMDLKDRVERILGQLTDGDTTIDPRKPLYKRGHFVGTDGTEWNGASIGAGDETDPVITDIYAGKTIYFLSDTAGTLTIQVIDPDKVRRTYDTVNISAGELEAYIMSATAKRIALKFDTAATVTAWYELRGG